MSIKQKRSLLSYTAAAQLQQQHVYNIEGWIHGRDIVIALNELKLGLLRQSCMSPGFSTLIANLLYTSDPLPLSCFDKLYINPSPHSHQNLVMKLLISRHNSLSLILLALQDLDKLYINPSCTPLPPKLGHPIWDAWLLYEQDQKHIQLVSTTVRYATVVLGH